MTVTKVLIDGGAGLNIIFSETLRKMGLQLAEMITPTSTPLYPARTRRQIPTLVSVPVYHAKHVVALH